MWWLAISIVSLLFMAYLGLRAALFVTQLDAFARSNPDEPSANGT